MLESETWRAMEPVRRALQRLKRRPTPPPFRPRLGAPGEAAPKGAPGATAEWRRWRDNGSGSGRAPLMPFDPAVPRAETVTVFMATYPGAARQPSDGGGGAAAAMRPLSRLSQ